MAVSQPIPTAEPQCLHRGLRHRRHRLCFGTLWISLGGLPSGKQPHNYRKSPCYQWVNPLFLWAIFNSKLLVYQRVTSIRFHRWNPRTRPSEWIQGVWVVRHQLPSKTKWWDSATRNIRGSPISNTPIISAWHEKSPGVDPSFPVPPWMLNVNWSVKKKNLLVG